MLLQVIKSIYCRNQATSYVVQANLLKESPVCVCFYSYRRMNTGSMLKIESSNFLLMT
jgi:hypothetical protein